MGSAYTVALVGFAQAESATFESFFRLAARRPPAYQVQDEVMDAQILIVNSDNAQALHLVRYAELPGKVLLVGHSDGGTGWPLQRKPVKLVSVLAALDAITGAQRASPAPVPEVQRGDVLLVAESLVEGRILHKRFGRYKLSVDWSRESSQALVMLKAHPYRLVVIDRLSGEPDAYQVCRAAKQVRLPNGQSPVVVMFASTAGSMDRIKAGLAGSDAYFPRSVNEAELYRLLAQHRLVDLDGFEKTNVGF